MNSARVYNNPQGTKFKSEKTKPLAEPIEHVYRLSFESMIQHMNEEYAPPVELAQFLSLEAAFN